jgi:hypothetical protein
MAPATVTPYAQAVVGRKMPQPGLSVHMFFDGFTHPHYRAGLLTQTTGRGRLALPVTTEPGQSRLIIPLSDARIAFATAHTNGAALAGEIIALPHSGRGAAADISKGGFYAVVILRSAPGTTAAAGARLRPPPAGCPAAPATTVFTALRCFARAKFPDCAKRCGWILRPEAARLITVPLTTVSSY